MPKNLEEFWVINAHHTKQLDILRNSILRCGRIETFKWSFPTYKLKNKNIVSIGSFKEHYALCFFQGVYLSDNAKVLTHLQEGNTKVMRYWKFTTEEIDADLVKRYVLEAIDNQKKGLEVKIQRDTSYTIPPELKDQLNQNTSLVEAFYNLTKGKQKEYANYIADAKQEKTKLKRMDKITPMILAGKGLNDRYI
jgi:uncharacterized protein YdeI (YjbR/CyaY-like superfamily)